MRCYSVDNGSACEPRYRLPVKDRISEAMLVNEIADELALSRSARFEGSLVGSLLPLFEQQRG